MGNFYVRINDVTLNAMPVEWNGDEDDLKSSADDAPFSFDEKFSGIQAGDTEDNTLHDDDEGLQVYITKTAALRACIEVVTDYFHQNNTKAGEEKRNLAKSNLDRLAEELKENIRSSKPVKRTSQVAKLQE